MFWWVIFSESLSPDLDLYALSFFIKLLCLSIICICHECTTMPIDGHSHLLLGQNILFSIIILLVIICLFFSIILLFINSLLSITPLMYFSSTHSHHFHVIHKYVWLSMWINHDKVSDGYCSEWMCVFMSIPICIKILSLSYMIGCGLLLMLIKIIAFIRIVKLLTCPCLIILSVQITFVSYPLYDRLFISLFFLLTQRLMGWQMTFCEGTFFAHLLSMDHSNYTCMNSLHVR